MTPQTLKSKRLYSIDALRGIAAMAIVVWHWQHFYAISGTWRSGWSRAQEPLYFWLKPLYEYGWAAVDLFFAVSGFVFFWLYLEPVAKGTVGAGRFALQRLSRLYPIYFVTLMLAALLQILFFRRTGSYFIFDANDWPHFIRSIFLVQQWLPPDELQSFNGPAWAVSIEVLLYIVFFLGARLGLRGPLYALAMVLAGVVIFPWDGQISRGIAGFFAGGAVFYATRAIATGDRAKTWAVTIAVLAAMAWLVAIVEVYLGPIQSLIGATSFSHVFVANEYRIFLFAWILIVCPLTLMALALHEEVFGASYARLTLLGDISYSTYMVHFPMQLALALLALQFGWAPANFMHGIAMFGFYAGMILLGSLSYTYFERPLQSFIRGRFEKPALSAVQ